MQSPKFLSLLLIVGAGCGARAGAPTVRPAPSTRSADAVVTSNGISENGISENGISENGISENGISENGISENGISENGISENGISENGISENGISENGISENGISENGISENGISENGISENGDLLNFVVRVDITSAVLRRHRRVTDAHLVKSGFVAGALGPSDFVGAQFKATTFQGDRVEVRVVGHQMAASPNADLDTYFAQWRNHDGRWLSLCPDGAGHALAAIAVYGYWDYSRGTATGGAKTESATQFTFACPNGAIGKCVNLGYRPWSTYASSGHSYAVAPYHQACTRLIRADYCGDGTPHTKNGETIEVYDNLGIQLDDRPSWIFEAQWAPGGATCVNPSGVGATPPVTCLNTLGRTSCTGDDPTAMLSTATALGRRIP
jgi:hypothetical protein